jgi:hypothetical protein
VPTAATAWTPSCRRFNRHGGLPWLECPCLHSRRRRKLLLPFEVATGVRPLHDPHLPYRGSWASTGKLALPVPRSSPHSRGRVKCPDRATLRPGFSTYRVPDRARLSSWGYIGDSSGLEARIRLARPGRSSASRRLRAPADCLWPLLSTADRLHADGRRRVQERIDTRIHGVAFHNHRYPLALNRHAMLRLVRKRALIADSRLAKEGLARAWWKSGSPGAKGRA